MGQRTYFYIFLIISLLAAGYLLFPYINIICLSFVIVNFFHPVFQFILKIVKRTWIATLSTVTLILILFLVPFIAFINISIQQLGYIYGDINTFISGNGGSSLDTLSPIISGINSFLERIPFVQYKVTAESLQLLVEQNVQPAATFLLNNSVNIGTQILAFIPLIVLFAFILWSAFSDYQPFLGYIRKLSPLPDHIDQLYFTRIRAMTNAMVQGTFVIAIIQGMVAGLVLWLFGVPYVFFLTLAMIFLSIVPLGAGFINIPVSALMILTGNIGGGIIVFIIHMVVISNIDNVLRPKLVPKEAIIHPVLLLLSVLGGVQVFGFFGIIYGPIIMIIVLTTLEVYVKYFRFETLPLLIEEKDINKG